MDVPVWSQPGKRYYDNTSGSALRPEKERKPSTPAQPPPLELGRSGSRNTKQSEYLRATFGGEASFCCIPPQVLISENPDGGMVDCLAGLQ